MIETLFKHVAHFVVAFISHTGYPGVILLMAVESACIPLPSEIIMPFSGYLVGLGRFTLFGATVSGAVGNLIGSLVIYAIGRNGIHSWLTRVSPRHVEKADRFYAKHGVLSVFLGRMLPVVRTFISLPAGIMEVPPAPFCIWTLAGSLPWCFALTYVGLLLGEHWNTLQPIFHRIDVPIIIALAAGIVLWYWRTRD